LIGALGVFVPNALGEFDRESRVRLPPLTRDVGEANTGGVVRHFVFGMGDTVAVCDVGAVPIGTRSVEDARRAIVEQADRRDGTVLQIGSGQSGKSCPETVASHNDRVARESGFQRFHLSDDIFDGSLFGIIESKVDPTTFTKRIRGGKDIKIRDPIQD